MRDLLKRLTKILALGALWVFVLSIPYRDQMLFFHAHEILVENRFVAALEDQAESAWEQLRTAALAALSKTEQTKTENF